MLQTFNEKNRDLIDNINGKLVHRDEAGVSPFDSSVQNGDAVWEGLRLYNGKIFKLIPHLDRLRHSALALAYPEIPSHEHIISELQRTLAANEMTDNVHVRLTLTRGVKYTSGMDPRINNQGPTLIILAEHKAPVYGRTGLSLITSGVRRIPAQCLDQNIHSCNMLNSILAKLQANQAGADDAIMLDVAGFVAETNATHLFIVFNGTVITSHTHACPEGITRTTVIELCEAHNIPYEVKDISMTEVYRADEVFCTGTMGELVTVSTVDARPIGDGNTPMTERLSGLYSELTKTTGYQIV